MSSDLDSDFFKGKRRWSVIKDKVLGEYMPPYLAKVARLGKQILLIDGYAGPGVFDDHKPGSPLIMCAAAEKRVKDKYTAIFVNHNANHHKKLDEILTRQSWRSRAIPILGDSTAFLKELSGRLSNQTIFLYLDPYGLIGCEFSTLKPFLERDNRYSTEIVINMSMPITHRLAARHAVSKGSADQGKITKYHQRLTQVFGGDYWKDILWSEMEAEEKELALIGEYRGLISTYLPYTGSCPVRESEGSRIKYFITFASRHQDAMLLMNDAMCRAYFGQMHKAAFQGTLFEDIMDWTTMRSSSRLDSLVLQTVKQNSGKTRQEIWPIIVQNHFMQFIESEYKESVQRLVVDEEKLYTPTPRKTKRLNNNCRLFVAED